MIQNLVWATAYNLIAIPVAAGLFVRWELDLPMSVGAVAMSLSTIIVAANAQLLRRLSCSVRRFDWTGIRWFCQHMSSLMTPVNFGAR